MSSSDNFENMTVAQLRKALELNEKERKALIARHNEITQYVAKQFGVEVNKAVDEEVPEVSGSAYSALASLVGKRVKARTGSESLCNHIREGNKPMKILGISIKVETKHRWGNDVRTLALSNFQ